jgi:dienelactone hydrolase
MDLGVTIKNETCTDSIPSAPNTPSDGLTPENLPIFYTQLKENLTYPLSWASRKYPDFSAWRKTARAKVMEKLIQPMDNSPFVPQVITEKDWGGYCARQIEFQLTTHSRVPALMLIPKGQGPFPAVLLLHDHGAKFDIGKEKMIEPWDDEAKLMSAKAWADKCYNRRSIGNELAARGYVVLAIDALGWGDRGKIAYADQQALASNLYNLGSSPAGLMAVEDIRSAEFLASLPEVNSTRVGAFGFSMGSFRAWQVAALSDTVQVGVSICWMGTTQGLMIPGNNLLRGQSAFFMTHPGLVNYLDYPDVASIAAPKPMLFYNGETDSLFPVESVKAAYNKLENIWRSQNAQDKLETKIWPGLGHICNIPMQNAAFQWLDRWLKPNG